MNESRAYAMLVKNVKCPSLKFGGIVRPATQSSQLTDSQSAIHATQLSPERKKINKNLQKFWYHGIVS